MYSAIRENVTTNLRFCFFIYFFPIAFPPVYFAGFDRYFVRKVTFVKNVSALNFVKSKASFFVHSRINIFQQNVVVSMHTSLN